MKKLENYFSEDKVKTSLTLWELFRRLWPYVTKQKVLFIGVVFSLLGLVTTSRLLPYLLGYVVDQGLLKENLHVVFRCAVYYLIIEIGRSTFMFSHNYLFSRMGNRTLFLIRHDLIEKVQSLPIKYFDKNPTGRIVTRLTNDVLGLKDLFTNGLLALITSSLSLVAILVSLLLISPKLTAISLFISPLILFWAFRLSQKIRLLLRENKKKLATINAFVAENISGMSVLQLHNRIDRNLQRFSRLNKEYRDTQLRTVHLFALLWPTTSLFSFLAIATAFYFGGKLAYQDELALGALVAFITHIQDIRQPLRQILERYQQLQNSLTSAERVFALLDEAPEDMLDDQETLPLLPPTIAVDRSDANGTPSSSPKMVHAEPLSTLFGQPLVFDRVNFRYNVQGDDVLKNINLRIAPSESIAIVGRTGSGKTTLISLIQRLYEVDRGAIFLGATNIRELRRRLYRQHIGVVHQDNFIFRGTLRDNISLMDPRIGEDKIVEAAKQACCWSLIDSLPGGLDYFAEERGANLSVGQRQLIAFARVLAFSPEILILDEATASIDSQSEKLIQEATKEVIRGRTSVIIAHRLSTILDCDRILVMDQGQIIEQGSHAELLQHPDGAYAKLYRSQMLTNLDTPVKSQATDQHRP